MATVTIVREPGYTGQDMLATEHAIQACESAIDYWITEPDVATVAIHLYRISSALLKTSRVIAAQLYGVR